MRAEQQDDVDSERIAVEACLIAGLDPAGIELIRRGTNCVYRLGKSPTVVRIAPLSAQRADVRRQVDVARWLVDKGIPATQALGLEQPIDAEGHLATFWYSVSDAAASDHGGYGSTADLGRILRDLHALPRPTIELPQFDPTIKMDERLSRLDFLDKQSLVVLNDLANGLSTVWKSLPWTLPLGPIHGDASVGNLLLTADGEAVLSDLDSFSVGPREWDLVQTAMYTDLYGWHTEQEYTKFATAYGWDIRNWSGYSALRDLRELLMVLWLAGRSHDDEEAAAELHARVNSLRTGEGRSNWKPL